MKADKGDPELPQRVLATLEKYGGWQETLDHIASLGETPDRAAPGPRSISGTKAVRPKSRSCAGCGTASCPAARWAGSGTSTSTPGWPGMTTSCSACWTRGSLWRWDDHDRRPGPAGRTTSTPTGAGSSTGTRAPGKRRGWGWIAPRRSPRPGSSMPCSHRPATWSTAWWAPASPCTTRSACSVATTCPAASGRRRPPRSTRA
jgi:hypothetical protein